MLTERMHILTSVIEHPATVMPCRMLEEHGWTVDRAPVDASGRVDVESVVSMLRSDTGVVTVMHANNETGTMQPIREIAEAAHGVGAVVHTDAAQSVGKVPVSVDALGVDLLSIAGHKVYAPKGVGALYVRSGTAIAPVLLGAGHERGLRPGTENVASLVGLGKACEIALRTLDEEGGRVRELRDRLWDLLREQVPGIELNGHPVERLPNTLNVRFPGVLGSAVLDGAPGVAASTGSACHEGGEDPPEVVTAMGVSDSDALGSVRLSLGRSTTEADVDAAGAELAGAWSGLVG